MKLIIDIPDQVYKDGAFLDYFRVMSSELVETIYNGIPLPKGHGDLKDTQDIINKLNLNYNNHQTISAQSIKDIIQTTPTIIEADKEE